MSDTETNTMTDVIRRLQRAFRVGAFPKRVSAIKQDAARYYGIKDEPTREQIVAYVRHNYTNYDRVCKRIPCSQVDHYEFRRWANAQVELAMENKARALETDKA